jgi:hypothetical protein
MNQRWQAKRCIREVVSRSFMAWLPFLFAVQLPPQLASAAGAERESVREEREGKERAAKTACLSGDYAEGVALLAELYVGFGDITYLFNQARCFEQNGRYADAIVRFREYQRKNRSAGNAPDAEVDRHIAECEALLEKQKGKAPAAAVEPTAPPAALAPPASPPADSRPPPASAAPANEPSATAIAQPSAEPTGSGSGLRIGGITAMAVGVLAVGAGVLLNVKANDLVSELTSSPTSYDRDKASARSTYETVAWLGYGAGTVCVLGGAILYFVGHSRKQTPTTSLAVRPLVGQTEYGAVLQGRF